MIQLKCFSCGKDLSFAERIGLREVCIHCDADVHVCRNCKFYDPKVYNECLEPQAEVQRERDRSNRCEYFQVRTGAGAGSSSPSKEDLLKAAEALFKKKP
jgi:hypothetical protein